eukprot:TRINITY_DN30057_c0_g1_i1.p1 TRINITY_DN30057_c0_g1~~TRINITY_DN30057_c0_g1_i1.p1  ORF type:complete len:304 (+),score=54.94 TRINITY_DN30057_c0_g1_i1:77-988(+)
MAAMATRMQEVEGSLVAELQGHLASWEEGTPTASVAEMRDIIDDIARISLTPKATSGPRAPTGKTSDFFLSESVVSSKTSGGYRPTAPPNSLREPLERSMSQRKSGTSRCEDVENALEQLTDALAEWQNPGRDTSRTTRMSRRSSRAVTTNAGSVVAADVDELWDLYAKVSQAPEEEEGRPSQPVLRAMRATISRIENEKRISERVTLRSTRASEGRVNAVSTRASAPPPQPQPPVVGEKVEVYSRSANRWIEAEIKGILDDKHVYVVFFTEADKCGKRILLESDNLRRFGSQAPWGQQERVS